MNSKLSAMTIIVVGVLFALCNAASAIAPWSLSGSARPVKDGEAPNHWAIELTHESMSSSSYGAVKFQVPSGKLIFSDIWNLSSDVKIEDENHCIGNSPRFVIELDVDGDGATEKRVMVYFAPSPYSTICYNNWVSSGNFMDPDSLDQRFDTSDFDSGAINATYAEALAIVGDYTVVDILLIVDGEITDDPAQAILVDNVTVNNFRLDAKGFSKKPADVEPSNWSYDYVEKLYSAGITTGCDNYNYCPNDNVTRAEMAVFILRAIYGSGFVPAKAHHHFTDVPEAYWAEDWLETLYWDGITNGCSISPAMYCPESPLSRAEMALFLLKAKHGSDYLPPAASGIFIDVPPDHWAASWIEQLYREGITTGCSSSPLRYCPEDLLTREQMATFLVRTFDLQ